MVDFIWDYRWFIIISVLILWFIKPYTVAYAKRRGELKAERGSISSDNSPQQNVTVNIDTVNVIRSPENEPIDPDDAEYMDGEVDQ